MPFRMMAEPDNPPRHSAQFKSYGVQKRNSRISATHLAKKGFYPCMTFKCGF